MGQISYIRFPFGKAELQSLSYAAAIAASINNSRTHLTIAQLTGAATLNLTLNSEIGLGATLTVRASSDATARTLTLGTGMTGLPQVLAISKSYLMTFEFDGSTFVHASTQILN